MRKATSTAYDALLAQVRENSVSPEEIAADGWKTSRQWSEVWGKGIRASRDLISRLIDKGLWESKTFPIALPSGKAFQSPHYRPKA